MKLLTPKKRNRRGMTLIEVCIAATISSLIAAIAVGLICTLMSVNSATKTRADQQRTVTRLADTFRADAHHADKAEIEEAEPGVKNVVFKQADKVSIRYTLNDGEVTRQVSSDKKRIEGDSFLFDSETTFEVSLEPTGEKTLAVLTIHQKRDTKSRKRVPSIVSAVGISPGVIEISLPLKEKATEAADATEEKSEPEEGTDQ